MPTLCLLLKAPRLGTVKTRLAADLGPERALAVYRALVERQASAIPPDWIVQVHYAPGDADAGEEMRRWLTPLLPQRTTFHPQPAGDLGARLLAAFHEALRRHATRILFAGGDCPGLSANGLTAASEALGTHTSVLIPAQDGGYVLLGMARTAEEVSAASLFDGIAWSTSSVFADTVLRIRAAGWTCQIFDPLEDIDDLPSLCRSWPELLGH